MKISEVTAKLMGRESPVVKSGDPLEKVLEIMLKYRHSPSIYVLGDDDEFSGVISLDMLIRHILAHMYEPQIHPRRLIEIITTKTAIDIMQKSPVFASEEEDVEEVLKRMIDADVKELAVLNKEKRVVADVAMLDLLKALGDCSMLRLIKC